jgi:prepilin-type N-terminal cleavage/methylation domain-containing protein
MKVKEKLKFGFTLVELLAVIVILAIILAIAVPSISGIIKSSTKSSMESDAKLLLKAIDLKKLEDNTFDPLNYNSDMMGLLSTLKLSSNNYENIAFTNNGGKLLLTITGKGKWAGLTACGSYQKMTVSEDGCELDLIPPVITLNGDNPMDIASGDTYTDPGATVSDNSGESIEVNVNTSALNTNAVGTYTVTYTAIDSSGNTVTKTRTVNVIVTEYSASEGVNRPKLAQGMTAIKWNSGTSTWDTVSNPDTDTSWYNYANKEWANAKTNDGSMWVWIPRYAYQIASGYHTTTAGTVNVKFLKNATNTASDSTTIYEDNATNTHYVKHPAFDFGGTQLTGIWVAKFEMSGTTASLDSKPGIASLRSVTVGNMFTASRNMETNNKYGWALASGLNTDGTFATDTNGVDTHMIKNIEWGAAAYLSQSTFGKNAEITINDNSSCYTGGGSGTAYVTNVGQSTTGNIYGIYDMSGGAYEHVMGNYNNLAGSSGLTPSNINNKYIDRYTAYDSTKYGDAIYETSATGSAWYGDLSRMIDASNTWFVRGGYFGYGSIAGAFFFDYTNGVASGYNASRAVVLVDSGL